MAATASEMVWLQSFVQDLGITTPMPMPMHCDNQAAIFIAGNLAFHERTKHIEIDCHFIRDEVLMGVIFYTTCVIIGPARRHLHKERYWCVV